MKVIDHKMFAMCEYIQNPSATDKFELGDIVINDKNEIGVIIQCHGNDEYRTDMWGNCSSTEIKMAKFIDLVDKR